MSERLNSACIKALETERNNLAKGGSSNFGDIISPLWNREKMQEATEALVKQGICPAVLLDVRRPRYTQNEGNVSPEPRLPNRADYNTPDRRPEEGNAPWRQSDLMGFDSSSQVPPQNHGNLQTRPK